METKEDNNLSWRKMDNSAKIFPISTGKKYSTVFRLSAVLKEDINKKVLETAVKGALKTYNSFKVGMKEGFFWYYLETNLKEPIIKEEIDYPCQYINPRENNNYLFKVTYFKNKINIDIFHSLTDGNNGLTFFREIVYNYLELKYPNELKNDRKARKIDSNLEYNTEDSYIKNYDKKAKKHVNSKKAYILKGGIIPLSAVSAIHQIINLEQLKKECEKYSSTITQYLTAVLIYSIYKENYSKYSKKHILYNSQNKPIKICIPVNLKKYFQSKTMSNFFSYITLQLDMENSNLQQFEKLLEFVKTDFKKQLDEKEIIKTMSGNVRLGINPLIKVIPLKIKKILVRLSYTEIRKYTTITFSNIGRVGIIGKYQNYIKYFLMLIAPESVEKIKCSSCTFGNKIVFTFTSILDDNNIQKRFYEFLTEKGINVEIESNGVLDDISK